MKIISVKNVIIKYAHIKQIDLINYFKLNFLLQLRINLKVYGFAKNVIRHILLEIIAIIAIPYIESMNMVPNIMIEKNGYNAIIVKNGIICNAKKKKENMKISKNYL